MGLAESVRCGVTALGEIAQPGWPVAEMSATPLKVAVFQELIAPTAPRIAAALDLAKSHLRAATEKGRRQTAAAAGVPAPDKPSHWRPGLSPHAPYTVHWELLKAVVALSAAERVPLAMHLAESCEEIDLLRRGAGPLRARLEELCAVGCHGDCRRGPAVGLSAAAGLRPSYLGDSRQLSRRRGNRLPCSGRAADDGRVLSAHAPLVRSRRLPVGEAAGGRRGGGAGHRRPGLVARPESPGRVAFCGPSSPGGRTRSHSANGNDRRRRALGWQSQIGSLAPGKQADLAIVALPDRDAGDPHELLLDSTEPVVGCYCRGIRRSPATPSAPGSAGGSSHVRRR